MNEHSVSSFDDQLLYDIQAGRNDAAKSMLNRDLARASDDSGTLLHYAAVCSNASIVQYLLELGSDVDAIGSRGETPLMKAVECASKEIVGMLLGAGANIDIADDFDNSALQMVFKKAILQVSGIFQQFIRRVRADASSIEESVSRLVDAGCTMCHAVYMEDVKLLECMRKRGAVDATASATNLTALHTAAQVGNVAVVEWLMDNGSEVNVRSEDDKTPLHYAAEKGNKDAVRLLLERGADPNAESHNAGLTPLWTTVIKSVLDQVERRDHYTECVELLVEYGVVPRNLDEFVRGAPTIFDAAISYERSRMIELLVAHLAMLQRLGVCDAEAVMVCNHAEFDAALERVKKDYEVCQRTLDVVLFGRSTLFDLLSDKTDFNRLRTFVRNETFALKVDQFCSEYKLGDGCYYKLLMKHIAKARRVVELEDEALPVICKLFEGRYNQCFDVARKVVAYLHERDLEQLILV